MEVRVEQRANTEEIVVINQIGETEVTSISVAYQIVRHRAAAFLCSHLITPEWADSGLKINFWLPIDDGGNAKNGLSGRSE
ncbi:hypothetical protein SSBR45G_15420 [Bradyrhizobium sp. SSBR45G]|nr:hypothetical protein SSBR45G_15420 [Bradyrhizobium sp. SSBR45G]GLH84251.1 hypothetical protein SSBR45R_17110 [Bradyrhizobium sp. SSBR45R]